MRFYTFISPCSSRTHKTVQMMNELHVSSGCPGPLVLYRICADRVSRCAALPGEPATFPQLSSPSFFTPRLPNSSGAGFRILASAGRKNQTETNKNVDGSGGEYAKNISLARSYVWDQIGPVIWNKDIHSLSQVERRSVIGEVLVSFYIWIGPSQCFWHVYRLGRHFLNIPTIYLICRAAGCK